MSVKWFKGLFEDKKSESMERRAEASRKVEKARELRRIKINIESQLRNFPGATCVDVNLVQPEDKSLSLNPYTASATVLIRYQGEKFGLDTNQVARMVAGGVPGLSADRVFVTLTRSPLRPLPDLDKDRNLAVTDQAKVEMTQECGSPS